jgi:hypothetical protein
MAVIPVPAPGIHRQGKAPQLSAARIVIQEPTGIRPTVATQRVNAPPQGSEVVTDRWVGFGIR